MDQIAKKYGQYTQIFKTLLESGAEALNDLGTNISKDNLQITGYEVVTAQRYPDLQDIDAILITGSSMMENIRTPSYLSNILVEFNCYDNDPWILKLVDFVKMVLAQDRVRIIGVCYGHQIVGRAMGMKTGRNDKGWEIAVCPVRMTKKGQELFKKETIVSPRENQAERLLLTTS